jgi:hypothetical protein
LFLVYLTVGPKLVSFTVNETAETEIVVEKDSELRLACEAEGNPSPSLALTKDGLQLEVYNGHPQKFNLSLKLNKTETDCTDAGVYSCRAQTGQGVANKSVDVNVRCELWSFFLKLLFGITELLNKC